MKMTNATIALLISLFANVLAQSPRPLPANPRVNPDRVSPDRVSPDRVSPDRVSFLLKNTLGYHQMFLAQGPGIAYGFTMDRREAKPENWPVGTNLYFSQDGETPGTLILTVTAADEGKTLTTGTAIPQQTALVPRATTDVAFQLRNTSLLSRKITLISYIPGEVGNGTAGFMMGPKGNKKVYFAVGTKLYIANSDQVNVVMSGKRIDSGKPFMTVTKEDADKTIDLE